LHALGPDYQSAFSAAESSAVLEQAGPAAAAVLEGRDALGPRLLAAYNAQVLHPVNATLLSCRLASITAHSYSARSEPVPYMPSMPF
jgi:hypothetical protein